VRAAPKHPLATVAAREIQDLAGLAGSLDARILSEAPQALAAGADGETAVLLRSALASARVSADQGILGRSAAIGPPIKVVAWGDASHLEAAHGPQRRPLDRPLELRGGRGPTPCRTAS
jgi:hypothetical protein